MSARLSSRSNSSARLAAAKKTTSSGVSVNWDEATLGPVVLVKGAEPMLVSRALTALRQAALSHDPNVEVTHLNPATYAPGQLSVVTSPSLFGEARLVIIRGLETLNADLQDELLEYLPSPQPDVWLVLVHEKGQRGRKVINAVNRLGYPTVKCEPLKYEREKLALVRADVRAARRRIEQDAAAALVGAFGSDLAQLCAAVNQLLTDVEGTITTADVNKYYAGRQEATAYQVADAALTGNLRQAMLLSRHAHLAGVAPQQVVNALSMKLRNMGLATDRHASAKQLQMAPWQLEQARRALSGWNEASLARAFDVVAQANAQTKGLASDPVYAVERCLVRLKQLHSHR